VQEVAAVAVAEVAAVVVEVAEVAGAVVQPMRHQHLDGLMEESC
jgi:hypothetical protein